MNRKLIIAIDGPSGAGKSTLSRLLAKKLCYTNIDTGAMYRTVALAIDRSGIDLDDDAALEKFCRQLNIHFKRDADGSETVWLGNENVSGLIRTPEMSLLTSKIAANAVVRKAMVDLQRAMGKCGGVVLEGRDIGSVVFPDAQVKFYLGASAESRGRRRYEELLETGTDVTLVQTIHEIEQRDAADAAREHAPLTQTQDAVLIDSTELTIDQVLAQMIAVIEQYDAS